MLTLESEEESGSDYLIALLKEAEDYIKKPDVLICLDSGCMDYEQLWLTSSLRGVAMVDLEVSTGPKDLDEGLAGVVPDSFSVMRALLDRIDDVESGLVNEDLQNPIPDWKVKEAEALAASQGRDLCDTKFNMLPGVKFLDHDDLPNLYLNNTWRASLSIVGQEGLPKLQQSRAVLKNSTALRLSCRLSPIFDGEKAIEIMVKKLTENPPENVQIKVLNKASGNGWCMKVLEKWLSDAIESAGQTFYGKPAGSYGDGGSIPFLCELGRKYPETQIIALGIGGPFSNMHGPNEMLELTYVKKLTCSLAHILAGCAE